MPPRGRREPSINEHLFSLGVQGRKTGVFLKDSGVRDEHGMQPLDDVFSSPQKENGGHRDEDESAEDESDDGVEMDIDNVTAPDPVSFMNKRRSFPLPLPRARSPPKTNLQSPAVKSAHLGRSSSPERGSIVAPPEPSPARPVKRKLDFSMNLKRPAANGTSSAGAANGAAEGEDEDEDEDEEAILHGRSDSAPQIAGDESIAGVEGYDDDVEDEEPTAEPEEEPEDQDEDQEPSPEPVPARRRGRPKRAPAEAEAADDSAVIATDEPPARGKKRGRPAKAKEAQEAAGTASASKRRRSDGAEEAEEAEEAAAGEKTKRRGRPKAVDSARAESPKPSKARAPAQRGRRPNPAADADTSLAEIPRGPPLPKSRGLTILRRETPSDSAGMFRTRSGRSSIRPLAFWKNEHIELQEDITEDAFSHGKSHFVLPTIKEVVRVDEPEAEQKRRARRARPAKASAAKNGRRGRRAHGGGGDDEDGSGSEVEREEWEADPGVVRGEVLVWQPEHEFSPPGDEDQIEVAEDQLAIAAPALQTQQVRNATFGFTKTLSMPFFGSGVVDLPPGAEKRPKNSRKMHMTFFVHTGRVKVTVGSTTFRIAKGGMWFVPRGNHYSIENEDDRPSRVFFAQGCEVVAA